MNRYETPAALRHDAHTLAEDTRALVDATAEVADQKVAQARRRLTEALARGKESVALLQEKAIRGAKAADHTVRDHPYPMMAVALGVGTLVGFLLCRRS